MRTQILQQPDFFATYCNKRQSSSILFCTEDSHNSNADEPSYRRQNRQNASVYQQSRAANHKPTEWVDFHHRTWVKFSGSNLGLTWRVDTIQNYGSSNWHIYVYLYIDISLRKKKIYIYFSIIQFKYIFLLSKRIQKHAVNHEKL